MWLLFASLMINTISDNILPGSCDEWEAEDKTITWNCTDFFMTHPTNQTCTFDYCQFGASCKCATFYAEDADAMNIECDWYAACVDSTIYCPAYDINACKIYIDPSGTSMRRVNIYVPNDYKSGYLQLLNKEQMEMNYGEGFEFTTNCIDTNSTTMMGQSKTITGQTNITFDGWYKCSNTDCCPWAQELCLNEPDTECNVPCSNNSINCTGKYIDGSLTTSLDIDCDGRDNCINSTILCPYNGNCTITCLDYHSCWGMTINYEAYNPLLPIIQDIPSYYFQSHISIYCNYDNACQDMIINTPNAQSLTLMCNNKDNHYDHHQGICENVSINANNVDTLHILCLNDLACVNMHILANDINEGVLYARSKDTSAWYNSVIKASNAQYMEIDCESTMLFYSACADSDYYVPSTDALVINCFGYGCYQMGNIHVDTDISDATLNYNGCGHCGSVLNCTSDLNIICDGKKVCNVSTWEDMNALTEDIVYHSGGHCGCNQLYINTMDNFENNQTECKDKLVFDPPTPDKNHGKAWIAMVAGIGCTCLLLGVAFLVLYYRHKKMQCHNQMAAFAANTASQGNVMMTNLNDDPNGNENAETQPQQQQVEQIEEVNTNENENENEDETEQQAQTKDEPVMVIETGGGLDDKNIMEKCQV